MLTLSTVLPEPGLAAELISTYVGHAQTPTVVTHLMLGPVGHAATIRTEEHAHERLDPVESARECAYDHAQQLIELLDATGHQASVQLDEQQLHRARAGRVASLYRWRRVSSAGWLAAFVSQP